MIRALTQTSKIHVLLAILLSTAQFGGCSGKEDAPLAEGFKREIIVANARADKAEQARGRAETEMQQSQKDIQKKDQQLQELAETAKANERLVWILGFFVVISLFIGIGIGSSARKKSQSQDNNLD